MDKWIRILGYFDWFLGGTTLLVGLVLQNWWVVGSGILGLLSAWYQPAKRIKAKLEKKLIRKKPGNDGSDSAKASDAFYAQFASGAQAEANSNKPPEVASFGQALPGPSSVSLSPSAHNFLKPIGLQLQTYPVRKVKWG